MLFRSDGWADIILAGDISHGMRIPFSLFMAIPTGRLLIMLLIMLLMELFRCLNRRAGWGLVGEKFLSSMLFMMPMPNVERWIVHLWCGCKAAVQPLLNRT